MFRVGENYTVISEDNSAVPTFQFPDGYIHTPTNYYVCTEQEYMNGVVHKYVPGMYGFQAEEKFRCVSTEPLIMCGPVSKDIRHPEFARLAKMFIEQCNKMFAGLTCKDVLASLLIEEKMLTVWKRYLSSEVANNDAFDMETIARHEVEEYISHRFVKAEDDGREYMQDAEASWILWHLLVEDQFTADAICWFLEASAYCSSDMRSELPQLRFEYYAAGVMRIYFLYEGGLMTPNSFVEYLYRNLELDYILNKQKKVEEKAHSLNALFRNAEGGDSFV